MNNNELYHHGILGMKWGIRRFQNPDGSLTEAGRRRYGKDAEEISRLGVALKNKPRNIVGGFMTLRKIKKDIKREEAIKQNTDKLLKELDDDPMSEEDAKKYTEEVYNGFLSGIKEGNLKKVREESSKIGSDVLEPIWKKHGDLINKAYRELDEQRYAVGDSSELFDKWQEKYGKELCKELGIPYNKMSKAWIIDEILTGDD